MVKWAIEGFTESRTIILLFILLLCPPLGGECKSYSSELKMTSDSDFCSSSGVIAKFFYNSWSQNCWDDKEKWSQMFPKSFVRQLTVLPNMTNPFIHHLQARNLFDKFALYFVCIEDRVWWQTFCVLHLAATCRGQRLVNGNLITWNRLGVVSGRECKRFGSDRRCGSSVWRRIKRRELGRAWFSRDGHSVGLPPTEYEWVPEVNTGGSRVLLRLFKQLHTVSARHNVNKMNAWFLISRLSHIDKHILLMRIRVSVSQILVFSYD